MKIIKVIGVAALLGLTALQTFAIEGLQLSVQCRNVCLSWPSVENESYIVQYRQSLTDTNGWQTLTASLAAEIGTNRTVFVHSNVVQHPNCGSSGNSQMADGGQFDLAAKLLAAPREPLAMPADGQGSAVPLALYPAGMDMSGFIIYDPATDAWMTPAAYSMTPAAMGRLQLNGPEPMDGGDATPVDPPETGFYRVVRNGVYIVGFTNEAIVSEKILLPVEAGLDQNAVLTGFSILSADGNPINGLEIPAMNGALTATWDTTQTTNGVYQLMPVAELGDDAETVTGAVKTIIVQNDISFPNGYPVAGNLLYVQAKTIHTNGVGVNLFL